MLRDNITFKLNEHHIIIQLSKPATIARTTTTYLNRYNYMIGRSRRRNV